MAFEEFIAPDILMTTVNNAIIDIVIETDVDARSYCPPQSNSTILLIITQIALSPLHLSVIITDDKFTITRDK